jgi:hypothetical protein
LLTIPQSAETAELLDLLNNIHLQVKFDEKVILS